MSINTPNRVSDIADKTTAEIIPLPLERKQEVVQETQDKLKLLTEDMQKISHADFLKKVDHADRLKYITEPNINSADISENAHIEFNFSFTSEKENRNLFLLTTAGQVLPQSVNNVKTHDGKIYSRESLSGEFFASDGKRLIIRDKTQIIIGELRKPAEIITLEKQAEESLKNIQGATDENRELLSMGAAKGINPELVLQFFSAFFGSKSFTEITSSMQEDFLTQVDREIGYMNSNEKIVDKNNLTEENKTELLDRMGKQTSMDSINYKMEDFPELEVLSRECGIKKPEFLYAIWELESSCGQNINSRQESRGRESLGMFQILNINLPDELAYELKNNPSDKDVNIRALRHFINNNLGLVDAINSSNYELIASIYNGKDYDGLAQRKGWTPYDDKLRHSVAGYYDRMNYSMAA